MPLIFLSYRRRDSQIVTRKIYQHLTDIYGNDTVFLDEESIPKGEDIREYIRDKLNQCPVVLAVIGAEWLESVADSSVSGEIYARPSKWVQIELEEALTCIGVTVLPLLVDGVEIPAEDMLPESLRDLTHRNALNISSEKLHEDLPKLFRELERIINGSILELPQTICGPSDDELLRQEQYRHEVRYCLDGNCGQLDTVSQIYLNTLRQHLGLRRETTRHIETTTQQAYQRYAAAVREFGEHLSNEPSQALASRAGAEIRLDRRTLNHLRRLHHNLAVPQLNAQRIERQILQVRGNRPVDGAGVTR